MVPSINEEPNGNTTNLDSRNKRSKIFCITCSSTAPSLEKQKSILNEMAEFVEIFIVFSLAFPVFSRRNDRNHSHLGGFEKDCVCVIAPVCQKIFRPETLHQLRCKRIAPAYHAHPRPNVSGYYAPFCAVHRLIAAPCASSVRMRFDMAGIHHQPLKVCVIHQRFQNPFPNSLIPPSTKPSVYILPVSIGFWQVPPRRSGAQNPEYSVDKLPGVSSIPASFPFSPIVYGSIFSQPLSLIPCRRYSFPIFQPSYFFEDYFIIFLLTTPSSLKTPASQLKFFRIG